MVRGISFDGTGINPSRFVPDAICAAIVFALPAVSVLTAIQADEPSGLSRRVRGPRAVQHPPSRGVRIVERVFDDHVVPLQVSMMKPPARGCVRGPRVSAEVQKVPFTFVRCRAASRHHLLRLSRASKVALVVVQVVIRVDESPNVGNEFGGVKLKMKRAIASTLTAMAAKLDIKLMSVTASQRIRTDPLAGIARTGA